MFASHRMRAIVFGQSDGWWSGSIPVTWCFPVPPGAHPALDVLWGEGWQNVYVCKRHIVLPRIRCERSFNDDRMGGPRPRSPRHRFPRLLCMCFLVGGLRAGGVLETFIWIDAIHYYLAPWRDGDDLSPIRWVRIREDAHDRRV